MGIDGPDAPRMFAMVLRRPGEPLHGEWRDMPAPGEGQILLRVGACGVCRTDLHIADGELPPQRLGCRWYLATRSSAALSGVGEGVDTALAGRRVGVPWLGHTCGVCRFCRTRRENLCDSGRFTGYDIDGGYAQYTVADAAYCIVLPDTYDDTEAAPLLCAGLIGFCAYSMVQREATDSARPPTFWSSWPGRTGARYLPSPPGRQPQPAVCTLTGRGMGGRCAASAVGAAGCGPALCARRRAGARCLVPCAQGRGRDLRRNSDVRHSLLSLRRAVGSAPVALGCQSDQAGWGRFFPARRQSTHPDPVNHVSL